MSFQAPPFPPASDDTRSPQLLGWTLTVTILALACVVVRMYTRLKVSRSVGWDDYTTLAAMVCSINGHFALHALTLIQVVLLVTMSLIVVQVHYGVGRHLFRLSVENIVHSGLYYHIVELLYIPGSALIKISACLFLLRIMAHGTSRALRLAVYFLMAVILILSLATGFTIIFRCLPVKAGWDIRIHGKCFSYAQILRIGYAQGGENQKSAHIIYRFFFLNCSSLVDRHRLRLCRLSHHHPSETPSQPSTQAGSMGYHGLRSTVSVSCH